MNTILVNDTSLVILPVLYLELHDGTGEEQNLFHEIHLLHDTSLVILPVLCLELHDEGNHGTGEEQNLFHENHFSK
jgi:hypothetical protein